MSAQLLAEPKSLRSDHEAVDCGPISTNPECPPGGDVTAAIPRELRIGQAADPQEPGVGGAGKPPAPALEDSDAPLSVLSTDAPTDDLDPVVAAAASAPVPAPQNADSTGTPAFPMAIPPEEEQRVKANALRYRAVVNNEELAEAMSILEVGGHRISAGDAEAVMAVIVERLLRAPERMVSGVTKLAGAARRLRPQAFDAVVDRMLVDGVMFVDQAQSLLVTHVTNLVTVLRTRLIAALGLTAPAEILVLESALSDLLVAQRIRLGCMKVTLQGPQFKQDEDLQKRLQLALKHEQSYRRALIQLSEDRPPMLPVAR